jgi:hypothetical protein
MPSFSAPGPSTVENGPESSRPRKFPRLSTKRSSPAPAIQRKTSTERNHNQHRTSRIISASSILSSLKEASSSIADSSSESSSGQAEDQTDEAEAGPRNSFQQSLQTSSTPVPKPSEQVDEGSLSSSIRRTAESRAEIPISDTDPKAEVGPFMRELQQAIFHRTDTSKPGSSNETRHELERLNRLHDSTPGPKIAITDSDDLHLPGRKLAKKLTSYYFTNEHVNLPIFDRTSFQVKYNAIWSESGDLIAFRSALNTIFALVTRARSPESKRDAAKFFFRAQKIIHLRGMEEGWDIGYVQAYILMSQYLVAVNNLDGAWKSIGIAIHIAQSLRLHLHSGTQHLSSRHDRELARKVWHCCIIMEK